MKKLAPLLLAAGAAAVFLKKRGAKAGEIAQQAAEKAPDPVKQAAAQAAEKASDVVERAREAAPGGGSEAASSDDERRYAAPVEAGSQPPTDSGEAPSDATVVHDAPSDATAIREVPSDSPELATPDEPPHGDAVMPDTSADDPLVRQQEQAAAADAGSIGGNADQMAQDEPGFPSDPARRPVIEGSGDPDEQTPEEHDRELGGNREIQP